MERCESVQVAAPQTRLLAVEALAGSLQGVIQRLQARLGELQVGTFDSLQDLDVVMLAPHIVLLEVGEPGASELAMAERMQRLWPDIGLILLIERTRLDQRLRGYALGADHCLDHPCAEEELLGVIEALMRRLSMQNTSAGDCWVIDAPAQRLHLPDGRVLALSRNECRVLQCLERAPQQTASRQLLAECLGANYMTYDERRLESIVSRLRRKIADFAGREAPIRALRNKGYLFTGNLLACR